MFSENKYFDYNFVLVGEITRGKFSPFKSNQVLKEQWNVENFFSTLEPDPEIKSALFLCENSGICRDPSSKNIDYIYYVDQNERVFSEFRQKYNIYGRSKKYLAKLVNNGARSIFNLKLRREFSEGYVVFAIKYLLKQLGEDYIIFNNVGFETEIGRDTLVTKLRVGNKEVSRTSQISDGVGKLPFVKNGRSNGECDFVLFLKNGRIFDESTELFNSVGFNCFNYRYLKPF